jgi:putative Holliday junction resolvase
MARVLAVDLGTKRIGIALSDASRVLASPLTTVARTADHAADRRAILALAAEHEADTIVVGLPLTMEGREGPAAVAAREEIAALDAEAADGITIVALDERLTTVTAQRMLVERGVRAKDRKGQVDKNAAAIILQTYLEGAS